MYSDVHLDQVLDDGTLVPVMGNANITADICMWEFEKRVHSSVKSVVAGANGFILPQQRLLMGWSDGTMD